jgi:hypothetical protein
MAFGTGTFQTGIQVRAQVHTSTAFEGSFHVKGTKLLKIDVGLPKTKQELLEYKYGSVNLSIILIVDFKF